MKALKVKLWIRKTTAILRKYFSIPKKYSIESISAWWEDGNAYAPLY